MPQQSISGEVLTQSHPAEFNKRSIAIKIFTLGRFSLRVYGEAVKARSKPIEALKVIIAHGGKGVRVESVTDALWQDAEADVAHHALETTLYRLRKLLGIKQALVLRSGQLDLDPRYCWVDRWSFERKLNQLETAMDNEQPENIIETLNAELMGLYQGPFLKDSPDQWWLLSAREHMHYRLISVLGLLGQFWEKHQCHNHAIDCYQRLISLDPLAEESYQQLMRCFKSLGRRAEAIVVYRRCRKHLISILDIEPSPDTEFIYRSLKLHPNVSR